MPDTPPLLPNEFPVTNLLSLRNLNVSFPTENKVFHAVRDISLTLSAGSVLALVGESGSGKSMTALSIMRLVPPPGYISSGEIIFEGINLLALPEEEYAEHQGATDFDGLSGTDDLSKSGVTD